MTDPVTAAAPAPPNPVLRGEIPKGATDGATGLAGRLWLMREVRDWIDNGPQRFLVLVAEPGWGKSAFAAWLVGPGRAPADPAAEATVAAIQGRWSAWHFCSSRAAGSTNPQHFCAALAAQLGSRLPGYSESIVRQAAPEVRGTVRAESISGFAPAIYLETLNVNARDAREVYDQAVRRPLLAVAAAGGLSEPTLVLVDAVDDALDFAAPTILDLLAGSLDLPEQVRFLITTRPESRVLAALGAQDRRVIRASDPARAQDNDADILAYVTERLEEPGLARVVAAPGRAADVTRDIVAGAAGNLLVAQLFLRELEASGSLPQHLPGDLYELYGRILARLMPETTAPGISVAWEDRYQPLLGALSVAHPGAPNRVMADWLGREDGDLNPVLTTVAPVIEEIDADGGSRRLYSRSLAEFLAIADFRDDAGTQPNRYFVKPRERHRQIVDFYLTSLREDWGGAWKLCDAYGLRELVPHLYGVFMWTERPAERASVADELCALALDHEFQEAQRDVLGGSGATIEACRLALAVSVTVGDVEKILERARRMADSREPEIRSLAARILAEVARSRRGLVLDQLKQLVR